MRSSTPNGSPVEVIYGQPKVHKTNAPMIRAICSAVGTSTYELSKHVANIISPAASKCPWYGLTNNKGHISVCSADI